MSLVRFPFEGRIFSTETSMYFESRIFSSMFEKSGIMMERVIRGNSGEPFCKIGTLPGKVN